jgi:hypothetical protein
LDARKYTPHETYHLEDEDNDEVAMQLLTADEKIDELSQVVDHRDNEI